MACPTNNEKYININGALLKIQNNNQILFFMNSPKTADQKWSCFWEGASFPRPWDFCKCGKQPENNWKYLLCIVLIHITFRPPLSAMFSPGLRVSSGFWLHLLLLWSSNYSSCNHMFAPYVFLFKISILHILSLTNMATIGDRYGKNRVSPVYWGVWGFPL